MKIHFNDLFGEKSNLNQYRIFPEEEIPELVDHLIDGIKGEETVERFLEETLKEESENTVTLEITRKDFGDMLLVFGNLVHQKKKWAEIKTTMDGLIRLFKEAHEVFKAAENEIEGLREVKKMFGWHHKEPIDKDRIFWEYLDLVVGQTSLETLRTIEPMPKKEAIVYLQKKYDFSCYSATCTLVHRGLEQWKEALGDQGYRGLLPVDLPEDEK